jgi:hypothetical protein
LTSLRICWREQKEAQGMPAGRHGHKIREYRRRIDALLEAEQERQKPPPPPISEEHAAMRDRIERAMGAVLKQIPEGMDLEEASVQNPELVNAGVHILGLMLEEGDFLAGQGVDPRPYDRYEPRF